jgi:single-strand DNA-binding protein
MAAKSLNRVQLIGNLGKDVDMKFTPQGTAVAKLTIATNESYKDGSEWKSRTEWHNVVLWARLAEIANEYCKKGSKVYIEGRLQTRSWDDKQSGQKKYMTEIIASDLIMLGGKDDSQPDEERTRRQGRGEERTGREGTAVGPGNEADDSDVPFIFMETEIHECPRRCWNRRYV